MKISNLKKGVVGVCAATMLAGMCAVPAFAADNESDISGSNNTAATGSSSVKVEATLNISATVPTSLPVTITNDTITAPSNFNVSNKTKGFGVEVTGVQVTGKTDTNFSIAATDTALGENALYMTISQAGDSSKTVTLTEAGVADLHWAIAKSDDGTTPTPLALKMDVKSGTLTKTFLSEYFTQAPAFNVAWTIGLA